MGFTRKSTFRGSGYRAGRVGFTLLEMVIVMLLLSLSLAAMAGVFSAYQGRTAAQRAAQVFALDIGRARASAIRSREPVVIDFDEVGVAYQMRFESGDTILTRRFSQGNEIFLSSVDLQMTGDSLVFDTRGVCDLSGAGSSLGVASFAAGEAVYDVSFNGMGASKVARR